MKKQIVLLQVLLLLLLSPRAAYGYGNDFLEKEYNYTATITGTDKIHFKLPVYSRGGSGNDYFVANNNQYRSTVYFVVNGSATYTLFSYGSEHNSDGPSANDKTSYGRAWVTGNSNRGIIEITNCSDGQRRTVPADGAQRPYDVTKKQESSNDDDYVTWLEVDWYLPEWLDKTTFDVKTFVYLIRRHDTSKQYEKTFSLLTGVQGNNNMIQPQLFDPYFYALNENGSVGYGSAAIPYSVFYDPYQYTTSLQPNEPIRTEERSGNIIVPTSDTVQTDVYANFTVYRTKSPDQFSTQTTNKVRIDPYHRLYDFVATEEVDGTGTFTGNNILTWHIKNPGLKDLLSGDYFELQRATKPDFSDARQLSVISMVRNDTAHTYRYVDKSRETWTGNAGIKDKTSPYSVSSDITILDEEGDPYASLALELSTKKRNMPSVPVYYRVRRASSSIWGWEHEFAKQVIMERHNFLAPLNSVQADYTLDPEYEKNRKVHFNIHIDNREIKELAFQKEDCNLTYKVNRFLSNDSTLLTLKFEYPELKEKLVVQVNYPDFRTYGDITEGTRKLPVGTEVTVYLKEDPRVKLLEDVRLVGPSTVTCTIKNVPPMGLPMTKCYFSGPSMDEVFESYRETVMDSMFTILQSTYPVENYGRSMWDRTARLVLRRTIEETDQTSEIIIPQDSIVRQPDGSWIAHYVDVANTACAHIRYSARIDQSDCDMHVIDSVQLQPVAIHGPSLYFDEAATITSFTASQGAAVGAQKRGVNLNWIPSSTAVDEYVLTRIAKNSDLAADTLFRGLENSFFDETAVPDVRYEYVITALFNCNGKASSNSATAEGWRSPYGEISGTILMPDNSGLAGVKVDLENEEGTTLRSVITGADGSFLFDSLTYDIAGATQYVIIPTHTYAHFSYNNTSAQSAAVTLSADHAVSSGINFANTSTVRLTGRALYKLSTIPVAGAMFTLNGDTVLRNGVPLMTGTDGNFELTVCNSQPYVLRIFKPGHVFEGDGILHVEEGKDTFAITKPLDGVRFYDQTKVRLVGRVAGGIDQRDLPEAFGQGTNNLGDNIQLVLQLEGDNIAHG